MYELLRRESAQGQCCVNAGVLEGEADINEIIMQKGVRL